MNELIDELFIIDYSSTKNVLYGVNIYVHVIVKVT